MFLSTVIIQGCAVASLPNEPINFNNSSDHGLLVGSITFPSTHPKFSHYFFRLSNNSSAEFQIKREQEGQLDQGRTYVFIVERPAGKDEIPSIRLSRYNEMFGTYSQVTIGGFAIPYDIKKGEITYIGNICFNEYANKGELLVTYKNTNFEKDIRTLKIVQPKVNWTNVKNDMERKIEYNDKKARL